MVKNKLPQEICGSFTRKGGLKLVIPLEYLGIVWEYH